ncbi:MFS transporter [Beauveria bassiana ARSEF 2860]|uniref:MFS transporter n=1 Tax=Beauveria bassiana (strain ARSEF 2860) TaxID=655819 RepID=J5JC34_BEAB2|nr:MFS transporter [Beauveria bassiana ARSEF 2860]EJP63623.1 MFS transporter [Beauveria bassiana ARSEF 2860]
MASPSETAALLSGHGDGDDVQSTTRSEAAAAAAAAHHHRRLVLSIVLISVVAADFGNALSLAPQLKLYESLICRRIFGRVAANDGDGGDLICKSPRVQSELAILIGWKDTFDQIPGITLVLLYGWAADVIGRKPVLLLALGGLFFEDVAVRLLTWWAFTTTPSSSLRLIWLAPIFQVMGGGPGTATSMAYSIITDTFSAADRTSVYFYLGAAILIGEFLATPLSALLMTWTPWLPFLAGTGCQIIAFSAASFLPETKRAGAAASTVPVPVPQAAESMVSGAAAPVKNSWFWQKCFDLASALNAHWKTTRSSKTGFNTTCMFASFLTASVGSSSLSFMTQYASRRFSWSIPKASLLLSLKGAINIVCLLVVLPNVSRVLSQTMPATAKELRIVKASVLCWTVGLALMAFAAQAAPFIVGITILSLGSGYLASLRSLANALVPQAQVGLVNGQIGLATGVGSLVAGPSMAAAFQRGMRLDGLWSGLPYIIAAVLFSAATALAWCIDVTSDSHSCATSSADED